MDDKHLPPPSAPNNDDDSLLSELASLTSLFSPEELWRKEEQLDDFDEASATVQVPPQQPD